MYSRSEDMYVYEEKNEKNCRKEVWPKIRLSKKNKTNITQCGKMSKSKNEKYTHRHIHINIQFL